MIALNWRAWQRGGKLRGHFDLELPSGMIIKSCALVEGEKGVFVSLPQNAYTLRDGTKKYTPIIVFKDKGLAFRFSAQALEAVTALREGRAAA